MSHSFMGVYCFLLGFEHVCGIKLYYLLVLLLWSQIAGVDMHGKISFTVERCHFLLISGGNSSQDNMILSKKHVS